MADKKKLVFVVEDNPLQQKMLQVHFEQTLGNYDVRQFVTPGELMKSLELRPHAVVLDHFYDGQTKTGLDYLGEIRREYKHIPIIYHTTLDDDAVRKNVMDLGAEMYIVKDAASLVRLRTALDNIQEKINNRGFFSKLFGK